MRYFPQKIESKWQKRWLKEQIYEPNLRRAKRPFYNLMMFPYPSAEGLHIGAVRTFSGVDIYGRFKRMQGYDVFEPIGLDGFGIHSENYALKIGKHPREHAKDSEKNFYRQLSMMGNGFAWGDRLETYDPEYYKWTQWIFVQMFKHDLAYRKKAAVNWCPSCKTVLADEQVIQKSQIQNYKQKAAVAVCERCGTQVVKKELEQWFFRITDYAERLLKNLEKIDWPEHIKIAQWNWIGKSEGALIKFPISNSQFSIEVFTTRPDTLFGATYLVVAPEHPLLRELRTWNLELSDQKEIEEYIKTVKSKTEEERVAEGKEKTGVELKGIKAVNPANNEEIPIWVADYILGHVGTGAIMAVPAHDERDFEFAKKFSLPIREVVEPLFTQTKGEDAIRDRMPLQERDAIVCVVKHWNENKYLCLRWKKVDWRGFVIGGIEKGENEIIAAKREIEEETGYKNAKFIRTLSGIIHSRFFHVLKNENRWARFHGLYFELQNGSSISVSEKEKEIHDVVWVKADEVDSFLDVPDMRLFWKRMKGNENAYIGEGILTASEKFNGLPSDEARWEITKFVGGKRITQYRLRDWLISRQRYWGPPIPMIYCEKCARLPGGQGWQPVPEKDLPVKLPYVKEFRPTGTERSPLATVEKFYKVRCPKCKSWARRETDVSDSFLDSAWYYIGYLMKFGNWKLEIGNSEFAKLTRRWLPVNMYIGGAEHSVLHLLYARFVAMTFHDWGLFDFEEPFTKFRAHGLVTKDGAKMSKSKGNVVNPDEYISAYGADAIRMYLAFMAPLEQGGDFRDEGIRGITRFLERVWKLISNFPACGETSAGRQFSIFKKTPTTRIQKILHKTIKKVTEDIEELQYNTAISALMVLLNEFEKDPDAATKEDTATFLKLLAPFAPHITEELWHRSSKFKVPSSKFYSIHHAQWPKYNPKLIQEDSFELVIQVNGKVRDRAQVPMEISEDEARRFVLGREKIKSIIGGQTPKKVIFVQGRLMNIVI